MELIITPLLRAPPVYIPDDQVAPLIDYMNEVSEERIVEVVLN